MERMRRLRVGTRLVLVVAVWMCLAAPAVAADAGQDRGAVAGVGDVPKKVLRVGMAVAPPFIEKDRLGQFGGLSYDLWRDVAQDLGLTWKVQEYDLVGLLEALRDGKVDVGVSDLSITPDRETVMDFSQPFYTTGFGIAVPADGRGGLVSSLVRQLLSLHVLLYVGSLFGLLLLVGTVVWLLERRSNPEHFHCGCRGIGDGLWWSAVTMTAVGYGDKTPKTHMGRIVALVWMFASVTLLAFFTAGIASSLTLQSLGERVRGVEDLYKVRTGVKAGSSAEVALRASRVKTVPFADIEKGLQAMLDGTIDAFVHDQPTLRYLQYHHYPSQVRVLPVTFDPQLYGFAFPSGSPLRKPVNVAMLRRLEDREYRTRLFDGYLGAGAAE